MLEIMNTLMLRPVNWASVSVPAQIITKTACLGHLYFLPGGEIGYDKHNMLILGFEI